MSTPRWSCAGALGAGSFRFYASGEIIVYSLQAIPGTGIYHDALAGHSHVFRIDGITVVTSATGEALLITPPAATSLGAVVKGFAAQSANLQEWRSSAAAVYGTVSENGYFTTRKTSAPADGELVAGEAAFWFDSTNGTPPSCK